jgi:hypothetical protein
MAQMPVLLTNKLQPATNHHNIITCSFHFYANLVSSIKSAKSGYVILNIIPNLFNGRNDNIIASQFISSPFINMLHHPTNRHNTIACFKIMLNKVC